MRYVVFILTLLLTITVNSQQESYHQDAMRYFKLNGTEKQYSQAIDQMFELLQRQFDPQGVPDAVWKELRADKKEALITIKSLLVSAYRGNFSHEDIQSLIGFYESTTGQQTVADISKLTEDQKKELSEFFESEIGRKVQNQSDTLKSMVSEVSELWSRDLYVATIEKLKAKGYQMPQ